MAGNERDLLLPTIRSISDFMLYLYSKCKGRSRPEGFVIASGRSLPEILKTFILNYFNKHKDEYMNDKCACISPNSGCVLTLMHEYANAFEDFAIESTSFEEFIGWCCKLFLQAAHLQLHGFVEAQDIAVEVVWETCVNSNKFEAFVLLGYKL